MDPSGSKINDSPVLDVETAVPLFRSTEVLTEAVSFDPIPHGKAFDEDEEGMTSGGSESSDSSELMDEKTVEGLVRRDGFLIGLITGCFIQFASLGARFLLTAISLKSDDLVISRQNLVELTLGWSFITSTMGVGILYGIGSQMSRGNKSEKVEGWRNSMELAFAVGALSSVCLAWTVTDFLLKVPNHATESVLIWLGAIAWAKVGSVLSNYWSSRSDPEELDELRESLLKTIEEEEQEGEACRMTNLVNGLLVGCFIQFSSLGANFLLQAIFQNGIKSVSGKLSHEVVLFSLGWAVVTSAMGVSVLILMRNILRTVSAATVKMESSYSMGAILGVNLSWILTDCLLGYTSLPSWWHWILVVGSLASGALL